MAIFFGGEEKNGFVFDLPAVLLGGVGCPRAHGSVGYCVSVELFRLKVRYGINISECVYISL
jgi:hypothetical protein